jgi:hypothetical protein
MARHLERGRVIVSLVVVLLSTLFINAGPPTTSYTAAVIPPAPINYTRNVALVQSLQYAYNYAPPLRTSADGRVALSVKEIGTGVNANTVQFYAFVPEAINNAGVPFSLTSAPVSPAPPPILPANPPANPGNPYYFADSKLVPEDTVGTQQHHTICDGTVQDYPYPSPPYPSANPYASNTNSTCPPGMDCYTLWIITPVDYLNGSTYSMTIYGVQVVVQVTNPKTTSAYISNVAIVPNSYKTGPTFTGFQNLLEPMVTADGHLIVGRVQGSPLQWTDNSTNPPSTVKSVYNIVYSVAPQTANPCDVTQWTNFYPIAHAPYDANMHGTYGLADYPFRDPENNLIPEQDDIEGTYAWIDRMGRNLFFENVSATLFNTNGGESEVRYPDACLAGVSCTDPPAEQTDNTRGVTMAGRWTHGKMVQLDALVNNIDYGLEVPNDQQRLVSLYQTSVTNNQPVQVALGSGRSNLGTANPTDYATNTTILDAFENLYTELPMMQPVTLREVVWQLNMGKGGDEIPFDDYINPEAFIISDMTASTTWATPKAPYPTFSTYNDGFTPAGGFTGPIHLQNSATTVTQALQTAAAAQNAALGYTPPVPVTAQWNIPAYGLVNNNPNTSGTTRIEPAALGGIKGKGFWLQSGNYASYAIGAQPQPVVNSPWFVSLFLDANYSDSNSHQILAFPDGTQVNLLGLTSLQIVYGESGQYQQTVALPVLAAPLTISSPGWWHLAFQVAAGGTSVEVFVDGFLLQTVSASPTAPTGQTFFQLNPGNLTVGGGFTGWIDEFKVIAQSVDAETICNHAHGTLAGGNSSSPSNWISIANSYPAIESTAITKFLQANNQAAYVYPKYVCYADYLSDASAAYLSNMPNTLFSVRSPLHFPEGPLVWTSPRPNSTSNSFCLSCHSDNGSQFSNTLLATIAQLSPQIPGPLCGPISGTCSYNISAPMWQDPRRQPMHPQRLIFGNIPEGFINNQPPQVPPSTSQAPSSGTPLDQWVFP